MGFLRRSGSEEAIALRSRSLIGRRAGSDVRIEDPRVSGEHALLRWTGRGWEIRDLGSRNGTFLGERRLAAGERCLLAEGDRVAFGSGELRFLLIDGRPPPVSARHLATGEVREAIGRLLLLPDDEHPRVSVFEVSDGGWRMEEADGAREVGDREVVLVGGDAWELDLPGGEAETLEETGALASIAQVGLRFRVSQDEEHVEVAVLAGARETPLPSRSYHYLLLTLARRRLAERSAPPGEQGWVEREALCRMLATDEHRLNVDICRARKQLAGLGIHGAANVVERRAGTGLLRIGVDRLEVGRL